VTDQRSDSAADAPISWRSIVYGIPINGPDGSRIGTVREVLGSDADDIFHGLRVRLDNTNRDVMIEADDVASLAANGIAVTVDRVAVAALPDFDEPATYHLSSVGWLRHHLGWKDDSKGDEEPG
jgi:hypothetical protein